MGREEDKINQPIMKTETIPKEEEEEEEKAQPFDGKLYRQRLVLYPMFRAQEEKEFVSMSPRGCRLTGSINSLVFEVLYVESWQERLFFAFSLL